MGCSSCNPANGARVPTKSVCSQPVFVELQSYRARLSERRREEVHSHYNRIEGMRGFDGQRCSWTEGSPRLLPEFAEWPSPKNQPMK